MLINELKKYFGFDSFRPGQEEIIQALLDGEDTRYFAYRNGKKPLLSIDGVFNGRSGHHRVTAAFSNGRSSDAITKTRGETSSCFQ